MFLFYTPTNTDGSLLLAEDELRHAVKTLRKRSGDEIWSTDGQGNKYRSRITDMTKSSATLLILDQEKVLSPSPQLHMAIALTKNASRIEWFLEKATEIGVQQITPIVTARTEKRTMKQGRAEKIIVSAMKQSLRYYLPQLADPTDLKTFMERESKSSNDKFVGHYQEENLQLTKSLKAGVNSTIMIGPEGDFTDDEIELVTHAGFTSINLGNHRLRTETAGITACHTFNIVNNG